MRTRSNEATRVEDEDAGTWCVEGELHRGEALGSVICSRTF